MFREPDALFIRAGRVPATEEDGANGIINRRVFTAATRLRTAGARATRMRECERESRRARRTRERERRVQPVALTAPDTVIVPLSLFLLSHLTIGLLPAILPNHISFY